MTTSHWRRALVLCLLAGQPAMSEAADVIVGLFNYSPLTHVIGRLPHQQAGAALEAEGVFVELLEHVATREDWSITYVPGTVDECLERLRTGRADLVLAVPFTEDLDREFKVSQQTVLSTWAQVYARRDAEIRSLLDLNHCSVGVMRDDPYRPEFRRLMRGLNVACDLVELNHYEDILEGLAAGWLDVGVVDRLHAVPEERRDAVVKTPVVFSPVELRFAAHGPLAEELIPALDYHLTELKADPESAYHRIVDRALGERDGAHLSRALVLGLVVASVSTVLVGAVALVLRRQIRQKGHELRQSNQDLRREVAMRREAEAGTRKSKQALERQNRALVELSRSQDVASGGLAAVLDAITLAATQALNIDRASVWRLDASRGKLVCLSLYQRAGGRRTEGQELPVASTAALLSEAHERSVVAIDDAARDIRTAELYECYLAGQGISSLVLGAVPGEGGIAGGVVYARTGEPGPWTQEEVVFADVMADYVGAALDAERRRQTEMELVRLERLHALGEMSAGVSHNLNNILTGILAPAQLIGVLTDDAEIHAEAECIISCAERARDLVHRLHQSTRGSDEHDLQAVDVNDTVQEAIRAARPRWKDEPEASGRAIELATSIEPVPSILGARSGLFDAIINLVFNAVDAMPEGGTLTVSTATVDSNVEVAISDTGTGMDEATVKRVFEPFFTTKMGIGTGLGLSTVYGTLTSWRGDVRVESVPGVGTTFTLVMPVASGVASAGPTLLPESSASGSILVVDDDLAVRRVLQQWLQARHEVDVCATAEDALEKFRVSEHDVAVIDLGMPGMPGNELARSLRDADPSLATVLVTGWELAPDDARLEAFDLYMRKPFSSHSDFHACIDQAMDLHASRVTPGPGNVGVAEAAQRGVL